MRKLIVLKTEWFDASILKKSQEEERRKENFEESVKTFRGQMVELIKDIKIVRQDPAREEILIEFQDKLWPEIYEALIAADIVSVIDSIVPEDDK